MKKITFRSTYNGNDAGRTMKVRNDSKTKTDMKFLAKGKQHYAAGGPSEVESEAHRFSVQKSLRSVKILHMNTETVNPDILENTNQILRNVLLFKGIGFNDVERDIRCFDVDKRPQKLAEIAGQIGKLNDQAGRLVRDLEVAVHPIARLNIRTQQRNLSKEINDLKSKEGFWKNVKPFASYKVNTEIHYDHLGSNKKGQIAVLQVVTIHVKKVWRETVNNMGQTEVSCNMMFHNDTFRPIKMWLESFKVIS